MLARVKANANLPDLRAGETADVDLDDERWFRRAASGLVTVLANLESPPPPPDWREADQVRTFVFDDEVDSDGARWDAEDGEG